MLPGRTLMDGAAYGSTVTGSRRKARHQLSARLSVDEAMTARTGSRRGCGHIRYFARVLVMRTGGFQTWKGVDIVVGETT